MKLAFGRVGFESHSNQIAVGFGNTVPFPKLIRRKLLFDPNPTSGKQNVESVHKPSIHAPFL